MTIKVSIKINGKPASAEVEERTLLVTLIREHLHLTGTHVGCDTAQCGACTVHMDGRAIKSCNILAMQAEGASITTIEGVAHADGTLHPMQQAFHEHHGLQCGFCTPGMVMSAIDFVRNHPNPSEQDIREGAAIAAVPMPANKEDWNLLKEDRSGGIAMVMFTWGDVIGKVGIDANRIYLYGRGTEAVTAAMHVATRYPHRFAGLIGMSGDAAADIAPTNFGNLPTFFAAAGSNASTFEAKAKELGYGNCTLKADGTVADAWAWIGKTARVANPLKVTFQPGDPFPDRAYWVRIPAAAGLASPVVAEADRATNTVKVKVPDVRQVTLLFNAELIDFSKPVNIEINGKARTEKIVPSVDDMLGLLPQSDNGRVYVTQRTYEVTQ